MPDHGYDRTLKQPGWMMPRSAMWRNALETGGADIDLGFDIRRAAGLPCIRGGVKIVRHFYKTRMARYHRKDLRKVQVAGMALGRIRRIISVFELWQSS